MLLKRRKSGIGNTKKVSQDAEQQPLHVLAGDLRVCVSNERNEMITALKKTFYERDAQDCARHGGS